MKGTSPRTPGESARSVPTGVPTLAAVFLAVAVAIAALISVSAPAKSQAVTTFTVDREDDRAVPATATCTAAANDCTLREAVVNANAVETGDVVIDFADSVTEVELSVPGADENESRTGDLDITRSMTIDGGDGVVVGAAGTFGDRIFQIFTAPGTNPDAEGTTATIESLTIQDGVTTGTLVGGGSIFGGGIFVDEWAALELNNSTVQNNTATIAGGGIYVSNPESDGKNIPNPGGVATITNSVITENTAAQTGFGAGGGIAALDGSTLTLTDSVVSDNNSNNLSGGIANTGDTTIRRSTISGNTATAEAGGIGSGLTDGPPPAGIDLEIFDSTISGNSARSAGGLGIINSPALVANSTISGNSTTGAAAGLTDLTGVGGGAGVQGSAASLFLESVTIAENRAPASGGGALASDTPNAISAVNTIVADNTQAAGGQCAGAPVESIGFNLEFPTDSCGFENTGEDPLLGEFMDNGGPTFTHALPEDSPALDQGNTELATDQRGEPRPVDFAATDNATGGSGADIGAFELQDDSGLGCTVVGTNEDDVLRGTPGRDVICGFGGDDIIRGMGGDDLILGGPGNDTLIGGAGNDKLVGGPGKDVLRGQGGDDRIKAKDGVKGNDVANGGPGRDSCSADPRDVKRNCP
ncbi:MAG: choice-of-anchor Q domain-containing protein [Rubrobacteraceae bacterium]